jgi:hypothetical protein
MREVVGLLLEPLESPPGAEDAEILEMEFAPDLRAVDLVNLPNYQVYVKLMIDGVVSQGFSGKTVSPSELPIIDKA